MGSALLTQLNVFERHHVLPPWGLIVVGGHTHCELIILYPPTGSMTLLATLQVDDHLFKMKRDRDHSELHHKGKY